MTNPDRVAFTIGSLEIYWYGLLMAVGIIIAALLAGIEAKRKKMHPDVPWDICIIAVLCGVVGARLYYVLFELKVYLANPLEIFNLRHGGLAIYGAVIGGLLGVLVYAKRKKIKFLDLADIIAPGLVLAQAIGRWGNFFNQEAYGPAVTDPNMLWFPFAVKIDVPWEGGYHTFDGVACANPYHMATFFYESMWCLLIFIFIWSYRKKFKHRGDAIFTYAFLYCFERAIVEGLRGDSLFLLRPDTWAIFPAGIRVSQLISALVFIALLIFFIVRAVKEKKAGRIMWPAPEVFPEQTGEKVESIPEATDKTEETLETSDTNIPEETEEKPEKEE